MSNEVTFVTNEQFINQNRVISESAVLATKEQSFTDLQKQKLRDNSGSTFADIAVTIKNIESPSTTLGDIKEIVDQVNQNGEHVFFDVHALGAMMYLCTVFFNVDQSGVGTYKINDLVNQRITEGAYDSGLLFTSAMAGASTVASQKSIEVLQREVDELKGSGIGGVLHWNYVNSISVTSDKGLAFRVIDEQDFINAVGECENKAYLLVWNGTNWEYNGVAKTNVGFEVSSGTPTVGDVAVVLVTINQVSYEICSDSKIGGNATVPTNGSDSFYIVDRKNATSDTFNFDARESFICITPGHTLEATDSDHPYCYYNANANGDYWCEKNWCYSFSIPTAITATEETGDITLRYSSYSGTIDPTYGMDWVKVVPYKESTGQVLSPYSSSNAITIQRIPVETPGFVHNDDYHSIICSQAITGETVDPRFSFDQRMVIEDDDREFIVNNLGHVVYGNPEFDVSNIRQLLNSEAKSITNPQRMHKNDVVTSLSGKRGDLWGLDPRVKARILEAKTYLVHAISDEFTKSTVYSSNQKGFLLSMKEMSFNINTSEGNATELYSEYTGGVLSNSDILDRAKTTTDGSTTFYYYWSRSANASTSNNAWYVTASGGYNSNNASNSIRRAPAYLISKS